jgi:glycine/D-amino acid oxidase-like deaminating enzyme
MPRITAACSSFGGVLVAVVGFSLVGWMGGVGIGLIAAQQMLNWHKQRSKDWEAIDSGKYAHLLTAGRGQAL